MKKLIKITIIASAAIASGVWYASKLSQEYVVTLYSASKSRALQKAVDLAFAQLDTFPEYNTFKADVLAVKPECRQRSPETADRCLIARYADEGLDKSAYYKNCKWWRFEDCAPLRVSPIFLQNPELMDELRHVLLNPCDFLPDKESVKALQAKGNFLKNGEMPHEYNYFIRDLGCEKPKNSNLKIILRFIGREDDPTIILNAKVGEKQ